VPENSLYDYSRQWGVGSMGDVNCQNCPPPFSFESGVESRKVFLSENSDNPELLRQEGKTAPNRVSPFTRKIKSVLVRRKTVIYRVSVLIFLMLLSFFVRAEAQETDAERVRKALRLPVISSEFALDSEKIDDEVALFIESKGYDRQIRELRSRLATKDSDPNLWAQIGLLHFRNNNPQQAKAAYAKVETLVRAKLKTGDKLPSVEKAKQMALLGTALDKLDKKTEAGKLLRDAVKLAPKEWSVWRDLGKYLASQFIVTLYDESQRQSMMQGLPPVASPERSERTLKLTTEATECFDRAVALAPQRSEPYVNRFSHRVSIAMARHFAQLTLPSEAGEQFRAMFMAMLLPESQQDLRNASLYGETAFSKGAPVLSALMFSAIEYAQKNPSLSSEDSTASLLGKHYASYPDATRAVVEKALPALGKIADSDPKQRAVAEAIRGVLFILMGQHTQGITQTRAALKERPTYLLLWNLVISFALADKNLALLEEILNEAVKKSDTPRNHILLAKVYQNTGRQKEKTQQVELALKKEPNDLLALLSAATLAFQSGSATDFSKAVSYLKQVDNLPNKDPKLYSHYEILRGVQLILIGKKDEGTERIQAVANADKENEQARDLLMALKP